MQRYGFGKDDDLMHQLSGTLRNCDDAFTSLSNRHSGRIGQYHLQIQEAENPLDLPIDEMTATLRDTRIEYSEFGDVVKQFERKMHTSIEMFRERLHEHDTCIDSLNISIKEANEQRRTLKWKREDIKDKIDKYEEKASDLIYEAKQLKKKGKKLTRNNSQNSDDSDDEAEEGRKYLSKAKYKKKEAKRASKKADYLDDEKDDIKDERRKLKEELRNHKSKIDELGEAIARLNQMIDSLHGSVRITGNVASVIQDILVAIDGAEETGEAFTVLQNALKKNPDFQGGIWQQKMESLREKWSILENLIVYGPNIAHRPYQTMTSNISRNGTTSYLPSFNYRWKMNRPYFYDDYESTPNMLPDGNMYFS